MGQSMKYFWLVHSMIVLGIILCAFSPFLAVAYAGAVAERYGCDLDEGSIHPCVVNGVDRGADLYSLGMLGWLGIATVPLGAIALLLYTLVVLLFYLVRWLRRRKASVQAA